MTVSSSSSSSNASIRSALLANKDNYRESLYEMTINRGCCLPHLKKELSGNESDLRLYRKTLDEERLAEIKGAFDELHFLQETIQTFLRDSSFDDFYDKFMNLIENLSIPESSSSKSSFSRNRPSYKKIDELFQILVSKLYCDFPDTDKIAFWSGKFMRIFFQSNQWHVTDDVIDLQIPVYKALFGLTNQISDDLSNRVDLKSIFKQLICMHIAYRARGDVSIYVSTDGKSSDPFLRVGNHFWNLELPILQKLKRKGIVKSINFRFFTNTWVENPIEIASEEAKDLKLVHLKRKESKKRVCTYPELKEVTKIKYVPEITGQEITLGELRRIVGVWKMIALLLSVAQKRALEEKDSKASV